MRTDAVRILYKVEFDHKPCLTGIGTVTVPRSGKLLPGAVTCTTDWIKPPNIHLAVRIKVEATDVHWAERGTAMSPYSESPTPPPLGG